MHSPFRRWQRNDGHSHLKQTIPPLRMLGTPAADSPAQMTALGRAQALRPPGRIAAPFHLNQQQKPVPNQQQVELSPAAAPVALQQLPTPPGQQLQYPRLSGSASLLCRHVSCIADPQKRSPQPWALGSLQPWTLRMRARLLSLLGALTLAILTLASAPMVDAAIDVAKQVLIGSDYSDKDLRGATFNLSNLREANLSGSDLRGASLYGAKLQDADLSNTDLREATLDSAVLTGTNLSGAVLEGAFAFNTRFKDVVINGTDFTDVPMRGDQLKSLCAVAEGSNPVTGRSTRDSLGCS